MIVLSFALAGPSQWDPPHHTSVIDYDLAWLCAQSPLVFEGVVEAKERRTWIGSAGGDVGEWVTVRVTDMLVGNIESGRIVYWDTEADFADIDADVGEMLLIFAGPKIGPLFTWWPSRMDMYRSVPPYGDVIVPTFERTYVRYVDQGQVAVGECFVDDHLISNFSGGQWTECPDGHWEALKQFVKAHAPPGAGRVMPGLEPEEAP